MPGLTSFALYAFFLAQYITKWDEQCDRRLYRLMCYIHSTYHLRQTGWIGDGVEDLVPHLFADADFAGNAKDSRSTSGVHLCILGPNSMFPIAGQCKKQGCGDAYRTRHRKPRW